MVRSELAVVLPTPVFPEIPPGVSLGQVLGYPFLKIPSCCCLFALPHVYDATAMLEGVDTHATTKMVKWRKVVVGWRKVASALGLHNVRKRQSLDCVIGDPEVDVLTERCKTSARQFVWIADRFMYVYHNVHSNRSARLDCYINSSA